MSGVVSYHQYEFDADIELLVIVSECEPPFCGFI